MKIVNGLILQRWLFDYRTPDIGYNFDTNTGQAFRYYTYGAACSEVEVDCLTGDHRVMCASPSFQTLTRTHPVYHSWSKFDGWHSVLSMANLTELN